MTPPPAQRIGPETPAPGELVPVVEGLFWLRFPLPFALNHVNLWVIDDGDGWALVDAGYANEQSRLIWEKLLEGPLAGRPVKHLIATHYHPDHVGHAGWLLERTAAVFWMQETEWLTARVLSLDTTDAGMDHALWYYAGLGLDDAERAAMRADGPIYARRVSAIPPMHHNLRAGMILRLGRFRFQVVLGRGHSPAQVMLACSETGVFIAADQILPRITPNIPVWPQEPTADPLKDFLDGLTELSALDEPELVLPSHDWPFTDLRARIETLRRHHEERLAATLEAIRAPATVADVTRVLFPRQLDLHQSRFALGETLAHLNHLEGRGVATANREDRVWRFMRA